MRKPVKHRSAFWLLLPVYLVLFVVFFILASRGNVQLLEPAGYIATIQSHILYGFLIFTAIIATALISSFFLVVFHFRDDRKSTYQPEWRIRTSLLSLSYVLLFAVISAVSMMVWLTAHQVDPYRPINSTVKPITIQVVALRWKWLFLYPAEHLATVNLLEIPVGTPVAFQLTADAPMNSFWIPRLSGQVYAMNGMVTQLHIEADKAGTYTGSPAEMSGDGFAGMVFTVKAVSASEYAQWKTASQHSSHTLDYSSYLQLARPSSYNPTAQYRLASADLFDTIIMQYMVPGADPSVLNIQGRSL